MQLGKWIFAKTFLYERYSVFKKNAIFCFSSRASKTICICWNLICEQDKYAFRFRSHWHIKRYHCKKTTPAYNNQTQMVAGLFTCCSHSLVCDCNTICLLLRFKIIYFLTSPWDPQAMILICPRALSASLWMGAVIDVQCGAVITRSCL